MKIFTKPIIRALSLSFTMSVFGCAQGNCRSQVVSNANPNTPATMSAPTAGPAPSNPIDRVRVFKYDGSLQCGLGKAVTPEIMLKELKNMKTFSSSSRMDGLMHISQCGTPTGKANVYEIDRQDLPQAQKLGFKEWLWE